MKTLKLLSTLLLLSAMCLIQSACKDKDEVVDIIEEEIKESRIVLSCDYFGLGPEAAKLCVEVEVDNEDLFVEVPSNYPWITCEFIESEQGTKSRIDSYLIYVEENDIYAQRTSYVDFYVGYGQDNSEKVSVKITQWPKSK
jgi:hypothetical protein